MFLGLDGPNPPPPSPAPPGEGPCTFFCETETAVRPHPSEVGEPRVGPGALTSSPHPKLAGLGKAPPIPPKKRAEGMGMGQPCPASLPFITLLSLPQSPFLPLCLLPAISTPPPTPNSGVSRQAPIPASGGGGVAGSLGGRQRHWGGAEKHKYKLTLWCWGVPGSFQRGGGGLL